MAQSGDVEIVHIMTCIKSLDDDFHYLVELERGSKAERLIIYMKSILFVERKEKGESHQLVGELELIASCLMFGCKRHLAQIT